MSIAKFSVRNPVLINIIMVIVFVWGIYTTITIPKEEMPNIDFGMFVISVAYPGVSPKEIESQIVNKIEDELSDIDNVDSITSTSNEGFGTIVIEMDEKANLDDAEDEINREVNKVVGLPEEASEIVVKRINMKEMNSICSVVFSGDYSENGMREIAEDLKDDIMDVENVSNVEISGTREREIVIDVDPDKIEQYNLSLTQIYSIISSRNQNIPGGNVYYDNEEFIIRSMGEYENVNEIEKTIISNDSNGETIRLKDVAIVKDTLEESNTISKLDMKKSVTLTVYKKEEGNIIQVVKDIKNTINQFEKKVSGTDIEIRNDGSIQVENSMRTLTSNAMIGILLVFIVLWMFIGWKNALFAAWGLPFSFLLTFIIMQFFGITINNLSLFGLILVLGMIVDDAIIVLENIQRYLEKGYSLHDAVIKGLEEIMWPVISAVLTTISAFIPLLLMEGKMGKFLSMFPIVVTIALMASLIECLIILPSHVAELGGTRKKTKQGKGANKLTKKLQKKYQTALIWALGHRNLVIIFLLSAMFLSLVMVGMGMIKFQFFPSRTEKTIVLNIKLPNGTNLEKTNDVVTGIENYILHIPEKQDIESVITNVGRLQENHRVQEQTNYAEIKIDLVETDDMIFTGDDIKNSIRKYLITLTEITSFAFKDGEHGGPPTGEDVELRIIGEDFSMLETIKDDLTKILESIDGITDIESSLDDGKREMRIIPDYDTMRIYGLSESDIANLVRIASYGSTVSKFRGSGMDEIDIVLKAQDKFIENLDNLKNLKLISNTGALIPLYEICDFQPTDGYNLIEHYDNERVFTITASTTTYFKDGKEYTRTPTEINTILQGNKFRNTKGLLSDFSTRYPGYTLKYGGTQEEQNKTYSSLLISFLIALLLVYAILGTQFKSYVQPLIVMMAIPFAIIGVIFGLFITGLPLSLMTMISFVALVGIVVNDSLVLVDFVNKAREAGLDRWNSLIEAGSTRLRPILMTTITTIAGFMPMILSTSSATSDWKPMAVAIAFGLSFATLLTLFVIPVIYSYLDSLFGKIGLTRFKTHIKFSEAMAKRNELEGL